MAKTLVRGDKVSWDSSGGHKRFGPGTEPFLAVLVGKDGGAKLRAAKPITARELMTTIDAMPMRQDEMRQRARSP